MRISTAGVTANRPNLLARAWHLGCVVSVVGFAVLFAITLQIVTGNVTPPSVRILRASPMIAVAVGDHSVRFVGIEITEFPLCTPWAIGTTLTMRCSPGTSRSAQRYLRVWRGTINYFANSADVRSQSASPIVVSPLP